MRQENIEARIIGGRLKRLVVPKPINFFSFCEVRGHFEEVIQYFGLCLWKAWEAT